MENVDGVYEGAAMVLLKSATGVSSVADKLHNKIINGRNVVARKVY